MGNEHARPGTAAPTHRREKGQRRDAQPNWEGWVLNPGGLTVPLANRVLGYWCSAEKSTNRRRGVIRGHIQDRLKGTLCTYGRTEEWRNTNPKRSKNKNKTSKYKNDSIHMSVPASVKSAVWGINNVHKESSLNEDVSACCTRIIYLFRIYFSEELLLHTRKKWIFAFLSNEQWWKVTRDKQFVTEMSVCFFQYLFFTNLFLDFYFYFLRIFEYYYKYTYLFYKWWWRVYHFKTV